MTEEDKALVQRLRRTYRKEFAATGSMFADNSNRLCPFPILATEVLFNPDGREAANRIEQLEREKAVVSDLWEQQKQIALDYLTDCNKAADHIEAQTAEIEWLNKSAECLAETRRLAVKDVAALEAEIERLREALHFYAEAKNWAYVKSAGCNCVDADSGDTARAALEARGLEIREKGR
jgi:hypothetical protein